MIKGKLINYGFRVPTLVITDHIFGAGFGGAIINPSGQYDSFLPLYEAQADNFETQGCTVWGTENALECLHKFKFGVEKNYEEYPPYFGARVRPESGGDPNTVAQWIRDNGLVETPSFPFPTTLEALLTVLKDPLPQFIVDLGQKWLTQYEVRHQWVLQGHEDKTQRMEAIKSALPYGVLGVSVTAWFQNEEGIYVDNGMRNTHWCVVYGWTDKGWKIFDSYDHSDKIYSFDARLDFSKLYFLEKKSSQPTPNWLVDLWTRLLQACKDLLTLDLAKITSKPMQEQPPNPIPVVVPPSSPEVVKPVSILLEAVKASIGTDASPLNKATPDVGCSESVSNILHSCFPTFPAEILSTGELTPALKSSKLFTMTLTPKAGVVVVSPRTDSVNGHTGIFISDTRIVSNDSKTGLMQDNYSWQNWIKTFRDKRGLRTFLFELK